jgi:hypothetical protein
VRQGQLPLSRGAARTARPYLQWSHTRENKRFTRWLSAEQEERYRSRINAARKLRELVSDLERLEIHSVEREEGWGT